jgi:hypothetical protein
MNLQKALDIIDTGEKLLKIDDIINSIQYIDKNKNLTNILQEAKNDIIIEMFNLYQKKYTVNTKSKSKAKSTNTNSTRYP